MIDCWGANLGPIWSQVAAKIVVPSVIQIEVPLVAIIVVLCVANVVVSFHAKIMVPFVAKMVVPNCGQNSDLFVSKIVWSCAKRCDKAYHRSFFDGGQSANYFVALIC